VVDDVSFLGTHIRIFYTEDSSIILENSRFPDVFGPDEQADALGLDNVSEQVKGVGAPPVGGRYIIRNNSFGTTKGHNDVIDVDSGRLPNPIVQIIGNTFRQTGDEHLDLGGDVYVSGNLFHRVFKDDETSDRGYSNGISTGDAGSGTTIAVSRNIFWDIDHAINLKRDTSTIFENNSIYKVHPDFDDRFGNPSVGGVVNLFIPTDIGPTPGDGAYLDSNIFVDLPRFFSGADSPVIGSRRSRSTAPFTIPPCLTIRLVQIIRGKRWINSDLETLPLYRGIVTPKMATSVCCLVRWQSVPVALAKILARTFQITFSSPGNQMP
jgi:hypothetical protein